MTEKEPKNLIELLQQLKSENVPKERHNEIIDKFLSMKSRKSRIPLSGQFELTPLCNLNCKMCYVHLQEKEMHNLGGLLPTERWKEIMQEACDNGMRYAALTGGECLTYPGFKELYLFLKSKEVAVTVLTNGVLLDRFIPFFQEHPLKYIRVTLYGGSENSYEKVTEKREFERVLRNIKLAKEAGLPISIAVTPSRFLLGDFEKLLVQLDGLEKAGIPYNVNSMLVTPREETGRSKEDMTMDEYIQLYSLMNRYRGIEQFKIDKKSLPSPSTSGKATKGLTCGAGRNAFSINWRGQMLACTNLTMGAMDLPKDKFAATWKKICDFADNYENPIECPDCKYRKICLQCPAMHYDKSRKGHCNPAICERTKMLAENGFYENPCDS